MGGQDMTERRTALYLRLSREDGDKEISESIANQHDFLTSYARDNGFPVREAYIDDGYSGTTFDRPGFQRMITDAENGLIDTIITKDLSRLGRDYIMTGHYIERVFPNLKIRYIAVNDHVDSDFGPNDMTPIRAVFNDYYARDISKKVKTALTAKKKHGAFTGSVPPYGYQKADDNKNKLVPDEQTAPYVRHIFELYLSGMNVLAIANQLTKDGVPTPSQSKNLTVTQKRFPGVWNDRIVRRILENPVYIGHMAQHKTEKISYKLDKRITIPHNEWIVVEDTHEPIVSREDFESAQAKLSVRGYRNENRNPDRVTHLLTGLVFCGGCGSPMATIKESPTRYYLVCRTWRRHAKLSLCSSHCIREDVVIRELQTQLRALVGNCIDAGALAEYYAGWLLENAGTERRLAELHRRQREIRTLKLSLYKDKVNRIISADDYVSFAEEIAKEEAETAGQIEITTRHIREQADTQHIRYAVDSLLSFEELDRNTLPVLVKRIEIGPEKLITIEFSFSEPTPM